MICCRRSAGDMRRRAARSAVFTQGPLPVGVAPWRDRHPGLITITDRPVGRFDAREMNTSPSSPWVDSGGILTEFTLRSSRQKKFPHELLDSVMAVTGT